MLEEADERAHKFAACGDEEIEFEGLDDRELRDANVLGRYAQLRRQTN